MSKATKALSPFDELANAAKESKPVEMGVKHFDSQAGNAIEGIYMGIMARRREEVSDPEQPDNRRKNIDVVYIKASEHLVYYTGNDGAVLHFKATGIEPGTYVRLTCLTRGVKGETKSTFKLEKLADVEQVASYFDGDLTEAISGFIE